MKRIVSAISKFVYESLKGSLKEVAMPVDALCCSSVCKLQSYKTNDILFDNLLTFI